MSMRFFKKLSPENHVHLSNGTFVTFPTVDQVVGYRAVDDEYVTGELLIAMKQGRYGLTEITWTEYERDYLVKKKAGVTSKPLYREELLTNQTKVSESTLKERLEALASVVGVASPTPASALPVATTALDQSQVNRAIARQLPTKEDFKPTVGRRRTAKPNANTLAT